MRAADAEAVAERGVQSLVNAAGAAVGFEAKRMLGSCYGSRVGVLCGPGLNGSDGRVAASWLKARGARVDIIEVAHQPMMLHGYDLVIDAAFGLGCSRPYDAPEISPGAKVLAVDLASGVESDTGEILGSPISADVTLAIGALKYAHVTGDAAGLVGELRFTGLGIVSEFTDGLVEDSDLELLVRGGRDDHKWSHAVAALCGSTLMPGAAELVVRGALAGGASMVRLSSRGEVAGLVRIPPEAVHSDDTKIDPRCKAVVAGPGLGTQVSSWLGERLSGVAVPVVLDADGLDRDLLPRPSRSGSHWIMTPHEGEFVRLTGEAVLANRVEAVRGLARETGCVVLLKGPTTIIADPIGQLRIVRSGTPALATAGSGDVLSGMIAGAIARGHDTLSAGALSAHLHGLAGARLHVYAGASDIPGAVTEILEEMRTASSR
jgi:NAD(P)H-hydrate epimerase